MNYESLQLLKKSTFKETIKAFSKGSDINLIYKNICVNFTKSIDQDLLELIVRYISKTAEVEKNAVIFVKNSYAILVPYEKLGKFDQIYELLYYIFCYGAAFIGDGLIHRISVLKEYDIHKFITLFLLYSKQFRDIKDPWAVVDYFLKEYKSFKDHPVKYITILNELCKSKTFRKYRGLPAWKRAWVFLDSSDDDTLNICFRRMKYICKIDNVQLPVKTIMSFLSNKNVSENFLNILMLKPPNIISFAMYESLIYVSRFTKKGAYVLLGMCQNEEVAKRMTMVLPNWINVQLPTYNMTFKILMTIFSHRILRKSILKMDECLEFIETILANGKESYVIGSCLMLRYMKFNEIQLVQIYNILKLLIENATKTINSLISVFMLATSISRTYYCQFLLSVCDLCYNVISAKNEAVINAALKTLVELSDYEKCRVFLKQKEILELLKPYKNEYTEKLLKVLK